PSGFAPAPYHAHVVMRSHPGLSWLAALALGAVPSLLAQGPPAGPAQRPRTHEDYDGGKALRGRPCSPAGKWGAQAIRPQWGDGGLEARSVDRGTVDRHPRGSARRCSSVGGFVVFTIGTSVVEQRQKRMEELAKTGRVAAQSGGQE